MNVPKLRFKEFDGEWEESKLSNLLVKIEEKATDTTKGVVLTSSRTGLFPRSEYFNGREEKDIEGYSIVPKNTFTYRQMSDDNTFHINYNTKYDLGLVSPEYPVFKTNNFLTDEYFLNYINNSPRFKKHCVLQKKGGTRTRLYFKVLGELVIAKPSIEEQKKIGDFFNLLNKKIQLQQQKINLLQEQKKGFLQKMFPKAGETQPEIRFDGFTGDWEQHKLGDIAKVIDPHPSHRAPEATKQGVPFIGIGDVDELGNINYNSARIVDEKIYEEHRGRYDLSIPSIGIGRVASLGKVIRLRNDTGKYTISPTLSIIQFDSQNNLDFLYFCMNTDVFQKQFKSFSNGSTRQSVGIQDLRTLQINLPTEQNEQENIGEFLSELQKKIQFELKKLETLKIQKQGFMQQMFI